MSGWNDSPNGPVVIALGSGAGGAGRTTIAIELARVLGRRGVSTVLVDGALHAPVVADLLGRGEGRIRREASLFSPGAHLEDYVERRPNDRLAVLTLADAVGDPDQPLHTSPEKLLRRLRRLDDRVVLLDLPVAEQGFWLDLFILSDIPIVISGADAWTVRTTIPFVKRASARAKALAEGIVGNFRLRSYLVLNGCRDPSERDLGEVLCHALWRRLGHYPRYLGPIDHDDRRWFHIRHSDTCPALSSADGLGVQVDELSKRIAGLSQFDQSRPRTSLGEGHQASARWMGVSETESPAVLRAQYRRLWEGYRRESAISQVVLEQDERRSLIAELEKTYRALQTSMESPQPIESREPVESDVEKDDGPAPPTPNAGAEAHCGEAIRAARKERGLTVAELSLHTRIGLRYLEAVEQMDLTALPDAVYLRGYLREIARALEFPIDSLLDRYLTELAERAQAG